MLSILFLGPMPLLVSVVLLVAMFTVGVKHFAAWVVLALISLGWAIVLLHHMHVHL